MKNDFTYCTIKYKHCKKQKYCKRWLANYDEQTQTKAMYDGRIWFMDGLVCVDSAYDSYVINNNLEHTLNFKKEE